MYRYFTTLKLAVIIVLSAIIGAGVALGVSNELRKASLTPIMESVVEECELDGMLDCHGEWIYNGLVLTEFDVVGHKG